MCVSCRWWKTLPGPEWARWPPAPAGARLLPRFAPCALAALLSLLAACGSQAPAPVTFGASPGESTPPTPPEPPVVGQAVPPLPGFKPAPPGTTVSGDDGVTASGLVAHDDLIAHIEAILLAEEAQGEPQPVATQTLETEAGTVAVLTVEAGDTLYGLARRLGVTARRLIEANGLAAPYDLLIGQKLTVPGSERPAVAEDASTGAGDSGPPVPVTTAIVPPLLPDSRAEEGLRFAWPVEGRTISSFGPKSGGRHNDGINISAPAGTPVRAAEDGVVAYAGDEVEGYGNLVLLRHAEGWVSAYAHNAENLVSRGQTVLKGDVIASVGASGGVSRPQSHFELRRGTEAVDPLPYLSAP